MTVVAMQQIRKMRGGSQAHLMLANDGYAYVVKFQNNPQHIRVLANELIATQLAACLGFTVPVCEVVDVPQALIEVTPQLTFDLGPRQEPCHQGLCFGSRLVGGLMPGRLFDSIPDTQLSDLRNIREFAGMLAFDKWTLNADGRQAVFTRDLPRKGYKATFIDFGYCFNAGEWAFHDGPLRGVYGKSLVYESITGWDSFEPWLSQLEQLEPQKIWDVMTTVPPEWYRQDQAAIDALAGSLITRRKIVRELIGAFRKSMRKPFPHWGHL